MSDFNAAYNSDNQFKQRVIDEAITPDKQVDYNKAVEYTLDDMVGVMEAFKDGAFETEEEAQEQLRIFLEEYTVKLLNVINK